jgi:putative acyl-CoA dehydrogenase
MSESLSIADSDDVLERLRSLPSGDYATHEVMNQATPFVGHNAFSGDRLLGEIAEREHVGWARPLLA